MRVADAVRVTSVVQRLKEGDKFTDPYGDWEVTRDAEVTNHDVTVWVRQWPAGKRARAYVYGHGYRVTMLRK